MPSSVSYCGLVCETCPIYIATRLEDKDAQASKRADIARMCVQYYGKNYEAKDINDCDGCRAGGRLFFGCHECPIRNCALTRNVETCAHCPDYICPGLEAFFGKDPGARSRLQEVRSRLQAERH